MANLKANLTVLQRKARERTVKTQNIEYDLETLVKKINRGTIKLDPEYQRRHRWNDETSSRLIESLILNIPVPLIYLSQDIDVDVEDTEENARYSVIDGQQRLTAIKRYIGNQFALKGLQTLQELDGTYYRDLPPFLIRRLEERTIKCLRIDSTVDSQIKYDIFERLNSGSVRLEAQELRNAIHRGAFNTLLKELSENEDFRVMLQIDLDNPESSKRVQKMEDAELVLRFFALNNGNYKNLTKGFKEFLSDEMAKLSKLDDNQLATLRDAFTKTMGIARKTFGDKAFAKYSYDRDGNRREMSTFNAAVFDALSIAVASEVDLNRPRLSTGVRDKYLGLFSDPTFFSSVEGSVNDKTKIITRIDAARRIIAS